jgi:hypothetical protein
MPKALIRFLLYFVPVLVILSCKSKSTNNTADAPLLFDTTAAVAASVESAPPAEEEPPIEKDFVNYPADEGVFPVSILNADDYHGDEVKRKERSGKWMGLFKSDTGYYVGATTIDIYHVKDEIVDDDDNKETGWRVITEVSDTALLLISGVDSLYNHVVKRIELKKNELYPKDSVTFVYDSVAYSLYATGDTTHTGIYNYRLFIKATVKGEQKVQLLTAQRSLDATMINILFIGDIDGDHVPDMIINTSNHYNMYLPTLYLSKPATGQQLLKPVGRRRSVGC